MMFFACGTPVIERTCKRGWSLSAPWFVMPPLYDSMPFLASMPFW
jgi:hypothetical protein